ncbi:MAG TPA: ABC transporter substrate-binding protein, partial [Acetobacteraceae bacterium]
MPARKVPVSRRTALKLPLLGAAAATLPRRRAAAQSVSGSAKAKTLRFVPYSNLIVMDPVWSISIVGLEHAYMTCDQLYGLDGNSIPQPQMAAGHELSDDKLRWRFTLRDGLVFHDGEKVRAADCVASIARWAKRDPFGQRMVALMDEMKALDDTSFEIRLKRPYAHMLYGLGGTTCFVRPERLAQTDISKPITDQTGSGPFRFHA